MTRVLLAIGAGLADLNTRYEYGAKPPIEGAAGATDCSGFIRRIVGRAGVRTLVRGERAMRIEDWAGSVVQYEWCRPVRVEDAREHIGCLLFMTPKRRLGRLVPGHVALSLGKGWTLEARGGRGVCIVGPAENRKRTWDRAGKLPELFEEIGG